jgi:transposase
MKTNPFIGIDVSKGSLDVFIYPENQFGKFSNNEQGFKALIQWVKKMLKSQFSKAFFAFEHTGLYSLPLAIYLNEQKIPFAMIAGLQLKRSLGIARGKSDKIDARKIAEYAFEKRDRLTPYQMPSKVLILLKYQFNFLQRLTKMKAGLEASHGEMKRFLEVEGVEFLLQTQENVIDSLNEKIKKVEKNIKKLIEKDSELKKQFDLINSINGVGPKTAVMMIVLTRGFTLFEEWRQFASYAGIAPFPNESGLYKGRTKVSHLANKKAKSLLIMCAWSAIQHNKEMKEYYERRLQEGKSKVSTQNIIRNKILSRIFSVIERGSKYEQNYKLPNAA